jgi:hypothetical protein
MRVRRFAGLGTEPPCISASQRLTLVSGLLRIFLPCKRRFTARVHGGSCGVGWEASPATRSQRLLNQVPPVSIEALSQAHNLARAIRHRHLLAAEMFAREMRGLSIADALLQARSGRPEDEDGWFRLA